MNTFTLILTILPGIVIGFAIRELLYGQARKQANRVMAVKVPKFTPADSFPTIN